jgi:hypothetical protein
MTNPTSAAVRHYIELRGPGRELASSPAKDVGRRRERVARRVRDRPRYHAFVIGRPRKWLRARLTRWTHEDLDREQLAARPFGRARVVVLQELYENTRSALPPGTRSEVMRVSRPDES